MIVSSVLMVFLYVNDFDLTPVEYGLWAAASLVANFSIVVLLYRFKQGYFERISGNAFRTNTGTYRVETSQRALHAILPAATHEIPFDEIRRIKYTFREQYALARELLLGLNVWDVIKTYRDTIDWFTISLEFQDGKEMPLFLVGQHQPRELFSSYLFAIDRMILWKLGLFRDAEDFSRKTLKQITSFFEESGKPPGLAGQSGRTASRSRPSD